MGLFKNAPFSLGQEAAVTLAQIVCLNGKLPQGAPTSPILSNMICTSLDKSLMRLAKNNRCVYTRYADDLTFSTNKIKFPKSIVYMKDDDVVLGDILLKILDRNSFEVNPDKVALRTRYIRQEVTRITVNKFSNVRRSYIKKLRAMLHNCKTNGVYNTALKYISDGGTNNSINIEKIKNFAEDDLISWFKGVLIGKIYFIRQVKGCNSITYLSFANSYNLIIEQFFNVDLILNLQNIVQKKLYVIRDIGDTRQGSAFFITNIGLTTCYHVFENMQDDFFEYKLSNSAKYKQFCNDISFSDYDIDYAVFNCNIEKENCFDVGDSRSLNIGDMVTIAGFPEYNDGDTPNVVTTTIRSSTRFMGADLFTVAASIVHGASGGVVLDMTNKVIGIIKAGRASNDDESSKNGFVPIHLIIDDIEKKRGTSN